MLRSTVVSKLEHANAKQLVVKLHFSNGASYYGVGTL